MKECSSQKCIQVTYELHFNVLLNNLIDPDLKKYIYYKVVCKLKHAPQNSGPQLSFTDLSNKQYI